MTTLAVSSLTVNGNDHVDAHDVVKSSLAFVWGQQDALSGQMCCPELYFIQKRDHLLYALGYNSVRKTLTTRQFLGYHDDVDFYLHEDEEGDDERDEGEVA